MSVCMADVCTGHTYVSTNLVVEHLFNMDIDLCIKRRVPRDVLKCNSWFTYEAPGNSCPLAAYVAPD